jgi:hypothetical protein
VVEVVGVVKENESVECVALADGVYGVMGAVVTGIGKENERAESAFVAANMEDVGTLIVVANAAVVAKENGGEAKAVEGGEKLTAANDGAETVEEAAVVVEAAKRESTGAAAGSVRDIFSFSASLRSISSSSSSGRGTSNAAAKSICAHSTVRLKVKGGRVNAA